MDNNKIVNDLAKHKFIENLLKKYDTGKQAHQDLAQDLYLQLLEKDPMKIKVMLDNGELAWYIMKMVKNNVNSKTSQFYKKYRKFSIETEDISNIQQRADREVL